MKITHQVIGGLFILKIILELFNILPLINIYPT